LAKFFTNDADQFPGLCVVAAVSAQVSRVRYPRIDALDRDRNRETEILHRCASRHDRASRQVRH
jgi:hypothetical protein